MILARDCASKTAFDKNLLTKTSRLAKNDAMENDILEFMGAPGSPYSRKMLALLRYRHIPYQISWHSRAWIIKTR